MRSKPKPVIPSKQTITMAMEKESPHYTESSFTSISSDDSHLLINKSRNGIPMYRIKRIMDRYDLTLKEMSFVLNISERTLQRYQDDDILGKDSSERALHLQRLYERGAEVLGSLDKFKGWMKSSLLIFKNEKPISFLDTIFGFQLLEQELGRIEYGILA